MYVLGTNVNNIIIIHVCINLCFSIIIIIILSAKNVTSRHTGVIIIIHGGMYQNGHYKGIQ